MTPPAAHVWSDKATAKKLKEKFSITLMRKGYFRDKALKKRYFNTHWVGSPDFYIEDVKGNTLAVAPIIQGSKSSTSCKWILDILNKSQSLSAAEKAYKANKSSVKDAKHLADLYKDLGFFSKAVPIYKDKVLPNEDEKESLATRYSYWKCLTHSYKHNPSTLDQKVKDERLNMLREMLPKLIQAKTPGLPKTLVYVRYILAKNVIGRDKAENREIHLKLAEAYPKSEHAGYLIYQAALYGIELGEYEQAVKELEVLRKRNPKDLYSQLAAEEIHVANSLIRLLECEKLFEAKKSDKDLQDEMVELYAVSRQFLKAHQFYEAHVIKNRKGTKLIEAQYKHLRVLYEGSRSTKKEHHVLNEYLRPVYRSYFDNFIKNKDARIINITILNPSFLPSREGETSKKDREVCLTKLVETFPKNKSSYKFKFWNALDLEHQGRLEEALKEFQEIADTKETIPEKNSAKASAKRVARAIEKKSKVADKAKN